MSGEMVTVNDIVTGPHLWAIQRGVGSQLDLGAGRPVRVFGMTIFNATSPTAPHTTNTKVAIYNGVTAAGDAVRMRILGGQVATYGFLLQGGVQFHLGLSIEVSENDASNTGGVVVIYAIE